MIQCTFGKGATAFLRHAVVDTIVTRGDEILLVKRAERLIEGGKWALVGGYVNRDEVIREAVAREVMEETGYGVEGVTLLKIRDNPDRPNEDNQNIAFVHFCVVGEKTGSPDNESTEQRWFPLSEIPPRDEIAFEHFENIELYREYLKNPFPLPRVG